MDCVDEGRCVTEDCGLDIENYPDYAYSNTKFDVGGAAIFGRELIIFG